MRAVPTILFLFAVVKVASAEAAHPYVSYDFGETRRTALDHRECTTEIFLTADDYVGYRYREDVFGSTTQTVQSVEFSNEYRQKATAEEQAELVDALLSARVFELTSEPKPTGAVYVGSLDVRINARETRIYFYSPPLSPTRKAIHDIMLQFAKRMKIDQPADDAKAVTVTEGDLQPARAVALSEVLARPDDYHGKRISVIGFYHREFECSSLAINQTALHKPHLKHSVWRSDASTFANQSAIKDRNDSWLRVDGIFLRGPRGHLGLWPGEIVRVTRIEPVSKPK